MPVSNSLDTEGEHDISMCTRPSRGLTSRESAPNVILTRLTVSRRLIASARGLTMTGAPVTVATVAKRQAYEAYTAIDTAAEGQEWARRRLRRSESGANEPSCRKPHIYRKNAANCGRNAVLARPLRRTHRSGDNSQPWRPNNFQRIR